MKTRGRAAASHAAFTLIEVVISASVMALILVSAYLCLQAGLSSQRLIEPRADTLQNARVALALIAADLRNACPLPEGPEFLGMHRTLGDVEADNLDFATHNYTPRHGREGDFCEVSYFVDRDPGARGWSLWRRRNPMLAPDPLSGGNREEIAGGIVGIRFEYFDGLDWYDSWGDAGGSGKEENSQRAQPNLSGMPEAVRITLALDSNPKSTVSDSGEKQTAEPPLIFQTITRLDLADRANRNDSTAAGGQTGNE